MERYVDKVAIVTGASSGLGEAIAISLTKAGMKVVGMARRADRVETLANQLEQSGAKGKLYPVKCNLRDEDDILKSFEWVAKNVGNVQVLINNAGTSDAAYIVEGITEEWRKLFDTNVLAMCITTREAVKIMKANKIEGHIININSIMGQSHMYMPECGAYGASKHAVTNLTEILRREMVDMKTNIKVTSISPGLVLTEMVEKYKNKISEKLNMEYEEYERTYFGETLLIPQDIADSVLYILGVPRRVQINELTIRPINAVL